MLWIPLLRLDALGLIASGWLLASFSVPGRYCGAVEITGLAPAAFVRPAAGDLVRVRTRRWALER
jgi:hypothetical protein